MWCWIWSTGLTVEKRFVHLSSAIENKLQTHKPRNQSLVTFVDYEEAALLTQLWTPTPYPIQVHRKRPKSQSLKSDRRFIILHIANPRIHESNRSIRERFKFLEIRSKTHRIAPLKPESQFRHHASLPNFHGTISDSDEEGRVWAITRKKV